MPQFLTEVVQTTLCFNKNDIPVKFWISIYFLMERDAFSIIHSDKDCGSWLIKSITNYQFEGFSVSAKLTLINHLKLEKKMVIILL